MTIITGTYEKLSLCYHLNHLFFNVSLTGASSKHHFTIQCHPNALCLKYNIDAVKKLWSFTSYYRVSHETFIKCSSQAPCPLFGKYCIFGKYLRKVALVSHGPLRNIIFTCISFMHKHNGLTVRMKNDSMST